MILWLWESVLATKATIHWRYNQFVFRFCQTMVNGYQKERIENFTKAITGRLAVYLFYARTNTNDEAHHYHPSYHNQEIEDDFDFFTKHMLTIHQRIDNFKELESLAFWWYLSENFKTVIIRNKNGKNKRQPRETPGTYLQSERQNAWLSVQRIDTKRILRLVMRQNNKMCEQMCCNKYLYAMISLKGLLGNYKL